jgi:hypothetical protein
VRSCESLPAALLFRIDSRETPDRPVHTWKRQLPREYMRRLVAIHHDDGVDRPGTIRS